MRKVTIVLSLLMLAFSATVALAEIDTGVGEKGIALESSPAFEKGGVPVDMFNVVRAETAKYFAEETILSGGNTMRHERSGIDLDNQTVIRSNFDLIYSYGVFDASGGLTVRVPEFDLYQSVQIFDENHITLAAVYPGEEVTLGPDDMTHGEHLYLFMRTQRRTPDAAGTRELNERQDAVEIVSGSKRPYVSEVLYDVDSFNLVRQDMLDRVAAGEARSELGFVADMNDIVFPHYQLVSIAGWAGQPATEAFYILLSGGDAAAQQGECSAFTFTSPDLQYDRNGYWSITLYSNEGWVATDNFNTNSLKAKPNTDGSYTIHFNCGPEKVNNLEVVPSWNGLMRLYLPVTVDSAVAFREDLYANHPVVAIGANASSADRPAGIPPIDSSGWAADPQDHGITAEEYIQGESRAFFANFINRSGLNQFYHFQGLSKAEDTWVVSPNNDTIYSLAIVNVRDGFNLMLPEVGDRFLSVHIIDENHMSPFYLYGGGERSFDENQFATDFVVVGIRTGTDGSFADVEYVLKNLHPKYKIVGANPSDDMARPDVGKVELVRTAMTVEYSKLPDTFGSMQSSTEDVDDWEKFTYVTAGAWGLSKEENAMYLPYSNPNIKGGVCYTATYEKVPAKAFFSLTAYGPDKYLMANKDNIVSTNRGLRFNEDGTFTVAFGNETCRSKAPNYLYTPKDGWSFLMRAYRPNVEAFRSYEMPEIELVE